MVNEQHIFNTFYLRGLYFLLLLAILTHTADGRAAVLDTGLETRSNLTVSVYDAHQKIIWKCYLWRCYVLSPLRSLSRSMLIWLFDNVRYNTFLMLDLDLTCSSH